MKDLKPIQPLVKKEREALQAAVDGWRVIQGASENVMESYLKISHASDVITHHKTHLKYGFKDGFSFQRALIEGAAPKLNGASSLRNMFRVKRVLTWLGEPSLRKLGIEKADLLCSVIKNRNLYKKDLDAKGAVRITLKPEAQKLVEQAVPLSVNEVSALVEHSFGVEASYTLALRIRSEEAFKQFLQTLLLLRIYCWAQGITVENISSAITSSVALAGTEVLREGAVQVAPLEDIGIEQLEDLLRSVTNDNPKFLSLARRCIGPVGETGA
jgi:hypothetical protein